MTTHRCGCVTEIEPVCGAQISVTKCSHHLAAQREIGALGEDYYRELGALNDGARQNYEREFVDGFGELLQAHESASVLEIGGGASPYVNLFVSHGYWYSGVEPSRWAREWVQRNYTTGVDHLWPGTWEDADLLIQRDFDVILCAHALEHMQDAPAALKKMANHLLPGGTLYILVPDDTDLVNPDHLWFFNTTSLGKAMSLAGLAVESMQVRRRVPHENFIYCKARKPDFTQRNTKFAMPNPCTVEVVECRITAAATKRDATDSPLAALSYQQEIDWLLRVKANIECKICWTCKRFPTRCECSEDQKKWVAF